MQHILSVALIDGSISITLFKNNDKDKINNTPMIRAIGNLFANNLSLDDNMKMLMVHPHPKEVLNLMPDHRQNHRR